MGACVGKTSAMVCSQSSYPAVYNCGIRLRGDTECHFVCSEGLLQLWMMGEARLGEE